MDPTRPVVSNLEWVADAIAAYEGWSLGSTSQRNRNPGNLRVFNENVPHDQRKFHEFASLTEGYQALLDLLTAYFTGRNGHGLSSRSTLLQMMQVYAPSTDQNHPARYALFIAGYVSKCTGKTYAMVSRLGMIWQPETAKAAAVSDATGSA